MKEKIKLKSAVHSKESLLVALLLAMNTGFVDAFTFFHFDGRFASLQTGNLIQTGINLAHGNLEKAFQFIIPILFFALGALFKTLFTKYKTQNNQSEIESLHTNDWYFTHFSRLRYFFTFISLTFCWNSLLFYGYSR